MRFCARPWCRVLVVKGYCDAHKPEKSAPWRAWYQTPAWRRLRARKLADITVCPGRGDGRPCGAPTVDVDHRVPHRGDQALFFDYGNLDAYCHRCHAAKTGHGL